MMLTELLIRNYILIDELHLEFKNGLNVFTGETGAGKSVVIGAILSIFGEGQTAIEAPVPSDKTYIEATFCDLQHNEEYCLKAEELGLNPAEELILAREIAANRSVYYLNGRKASHTIMKELKSVLCDFHHQQDQQKILSPAYQLELLDRFGGLMILRESFSKLYQEIKNKLSVLHELKKQESDRNQLHELYTYQSNELATAALKADTDASLQQEFELANNAEEIKNIAANLYLALYQTENSIYDQLNSGKAQLDRFTDVHPSIQEISSEMVDSLERIRDIALALQNLSETTNYDPQRLQQLQERLDLINSLMYKHKVTTVAELIEYHHKIDQLIDSFETKQQEIIDLTEEISSGLSILAETANRLTVSRTDCAKKLCSELEGSIRQLAIPDARIELRIDKIQQCQNDIDGSLKNYNETGQDRVEILFSANPGSNLRPLKDVASGGEMSRILLAAKKILAINMSDKLIIMDEIDSGIGGKTAEAVAEFIRSLSMEHQVFCITHLAKIAAQGDCHMLLQKQTDSGRTTLQVSVLGAAQQQFEIARMLSGKITEASLEHAKEILDK